MGKEQVQIVINAKDNASKKLGAVRGALGGISSVATGMIAANVLTGVARQLTSLSGAAISVESAMAGVTKTTDGLLDEFGKLNYMGETLKTGFRELAKEIPMSVEELMHIGELGGQLGIAQDNLLDFTRTIADLGVTTNLSTEDAAMSLAQLMNAMATNQTDIDKLGSVIVDLGNNFATTEADIVGFASRIAGVGAIAGLSEADVMGISAAFSSVGIQAEAGGTAVQKVLMKMNEAVAGGIGTSEIIDNTEAMAKMQEKYVDATGKLRGLEASVEMSAGALQSEYDAFIAAGGAAEKWGEQLGDKNRRKLWKAMRDMQEYEQALSSLKAEHGSAAAGDEGFLGVFAQAAGMSAAEFSAAWEADPAKAFQAFVEGLGRAGDDAMGILKGLQLEDQRLMRAFLSLSKAGDLLGNSIDRGTEAWGDNNALTKEAEQRYRTTQAQLEIMKNRIRDIAITLGDIFLPVLNKALGFLTPVVEGFSDFAHYIGVVISDGDTLNDYLSKLPEPLQGIAKAMGNVIVFIQENWEEGWALFRSVLDPIVSWIQGAWTVAVANMQAALQMVTGWIVANWDTIWGNAVLAVEGVANIFKSFYEEIQPKLQPFWDSLVKYLETVTDLVNTLTGDMDTGLIGNKQGWMDLTEQAGIFMSTPLGAALENITWGLGAMRDVIEFVNGLLDKLTVKTDETSFAGKIWNATLMALGKIITTLAGGPFVWIKTALEAIENLVQTINSLSMSAIISDLEKIGGLMPNLSGLGGILSFQSGGMVPGPMGAPRIIEAHGGELVLNPQQQQQLMFNLTVNSQAPVSSVIQDFNMLKSMAGVA